MPLRELIRQLDVFKPRFQRIAKEREAQRLKQELEAKRASSANGRPSRASKPNHFTYTVPNRGRRR